MRRALLGRRWLIAVTCLFCLLPRAADAACRITTTPVNFGSYDVFSAAPLDSLGSITVDCSFDPPPPSPPVDVLITISQSTNSGAFIPRSMRHSARPDLLNYNLYTDASMTSIWGNGTGGTSVVTLLKVKKDDPPLVSTVYGRIPSGQDVWAGLYSETLIVTITY